MGLGLSMPIGSELRAVIRHRPTTIFSLLAVASLLITAFFGGLVGILPSANVQARHGQGGRVVVDGLAAGMREGTARFVDQAGQIRLELPLRELIGELEPRGTPAENTAMFARRDQTSALLREAGVTLQLPDGRVLSVFTVPSRGFHLQLDSWIALGVGFLSLIIGLWVLVLRPRELTAQLFAISGASLWTASLTIALTVESSIATPGWGMKYLLQVNHISALVFSWALVSIFGVYPLPIVPRIAIAGLALLMGGLGVAGLYDAWTDVFGTQLIAMVALVVLTFVLVLIQAWISRRDPVHRASVAWIGTALVLSAGLFTAVNFIPLLMGSPPLLGDAIAMTAFLLFYFALAVAITRYRMFDLGNWTVHVVRAVIVLLLILVADMALVYWAGEQWTLSIAVLLVALAWMPVRGRLMRLAERRRDRDNMRLIRGANQVAFAIRPSEQAAHWRDALAAQFDPLEISGARADVAEIRDDGRILAIPSPLGGEALALGYAGKGSRLFDSNDLEMAKALHRLVEEMIAARRAYDQGVREERTRIARDLHDDVGARLLTGLHMADQRLRPTLQAAMSDIRAIVSGMTGEQVSLERLLSEVRHETARRLEATDIRLDWPLSEEPDEECLLDYRRNKAITSAFREVVSNVIRHARATTLQVRISAGVDRLDAVVRDDGDGMPEAALAGETQGFGLRNLKRRLIDVGGQIDIRSGPGGTEISLSMPLGLAAASSTSKQGVTEPRGDLPWPT
ncbi:sensor histidine kinase [Kaistia sp. MMO-174]|uniref:sensor histidine kinase n=1 Tax=Kaistia sp. MMO-174 TaxID=3081256 RepID=UPI003016F875